MATQIRIVQDAPNVQLQVDYHSESEALAIIHMSLVDVDGTECEFQFNEKEYDEFVTFLSNFADKCTELVP